MILLSFCFKDQKICKYSKVLVSGSSENHGNLLILMLYNVIKLNNKLCFVIWDLGLSKKQRKKLFNLKENAEQAKNRNIYVFYHLFIYSKYPSYFNININAGNYAWKPVIIHDTYKLYKTTLFWLDAGCYVNGSLDSIYGYIERMKIWSISAGHSIKRFAYDSVLKLFNVSERIKELTMCAAGVVGFLYPSHFSQYILEMWRKCALQIDCIAPKGSNRKNHRQDQTALSIILYKNGYKYKCIKYNNLNFSLQFDGKINKFKKFKYWIA